MLTPFISSLRGLSFIYLFLPLNPPSILWGGYHFYLFGGYPFDSPWRGPWLSMPDVWHEGLGPEVEACEGTQWDGALKKVAVVSKAVELDLQAAALQLNCEVSASSTVLTGSALSQVAPPQFKGRVSAGNMVQRGFALLQIALLALWQRVCAPNIVQQCLLCCRLQRFNASKSPPPRTRCRRNLPHRRLHRPARSRGLSAVLISLQNTV